MEVFLIIVFIIIYGLFMCYRMLIESTDEWLEKSMDRAYSLAKLMEHKDI